MFVFDTESPRLKSLLRSLQYALLTLLVVGGTVLLVFSGQGYDFNRATGQVIQNGLLLINTQPENSKVVINGQEEPDQTPGRFALPAGNYDVKLHLDGYRDWQKRVSLSPSGVEWLYYPLLIPNELVTSRVGVWRNLEFIAQAPNVTTALLRQATDTPNFSLLTLDGKTITQEETISLAPSILGLTQGDALGSFEFIEWTGNSRHALLSYSRGEQRQYIWFDTADPELSLNLNQLFDLPITQPTFIDGQANLVFVLVDGDLRRLNINQRTISTPLALGVTDYQSLGDDRVAYLSSRDGLTQLTLQQSETSFIVANNLTGAPNRYQLEIAEFDRDLYVAWLDVRGERLTIKRNPQLEEQAAQSVILETPGAQFLSFSNNAQFIMAQGGGQFVTYDLDRSRSYNFATPHSQPLADEVVWMDGYRLLSFDQKDRLYVFEFDGANLVRLGSANPDFPIFFAPEYTAFYGLSPANQSPNSFLNHTSLTVEQTN